MSANLAASLLIILANAFNMLSLWKGMTSDESGKRKYTRTGILLLGVAALFLLAAVVLFIVG